MKKWFLLLILCPILLSGCRKQASGQIVATTLPVYTFTNTLCEGTGITVSRLVTENVSCLHDYSLQVSQMRAIEEAQVIVLSGAGLEDFLSDAMQSAHRVIDASSDLQLHCEHDHAQEHDGHHHETDPHIWLSPQMAGQMCETICRELSVLYPDYAQQFAQNLTDLLAQLDTLQQYGNAVLQNISCKSLITFHDGFSYFAESFELQILKAVEEESGSEASASELTDLIKLVKDYQLPAIFTEKNGSTSAAKVVAAETGARLFTLDMAITGDDYFSAMYYNINTMKEAL